MSHKTAVLDVTSAPVRGAGELLERMPNGNVRRVKGQFYDDNRDAITFHVTADADISAGDFLEVSPNGNVRPMSDTSKWVGVAVGSAKKGAEVIMAVKRYG